ncbi:cytoplasmic dynein 1 light intermediate chain 2-like [Watersipora subatra]|uniref:cytoplasmic dynein 1 light intermediate chain 2-like n=1 Tax=Watersipora subatra TaxID=2589382 RepID=UPI00355BE7E2
MATSREELLNKPADFDDAIDDDDESNLWEDLLNEAKQSSSKLQEHKNLIILGDLSCGKTTLIAKLQGNEEPEKGSGLEFAHLTISDEYREDSTKLGLWMLDGDATHTGLLKYALTADNFMDSLILVTVSMAQPWSILKSITNWLSIITDHIDRIGIPNEVMQQCKQKIIKHYQDYVEPDSLSSSRLTAPSSGEDSDPSVLPLGENVLINNLGVPVIVVLTKSDAISTLEKEMDYKEERFDFIQQHVRKLCLTYGAALFYVSVREEKNCDLLHKYIAHRVYGLEFSSPPSVVERDALFIPSGWDSDKKIAILAENLVTIKPDEEFEAVIKRPPALRRPANRDGEVAAEDQQDFLNRCQGLLAKGAPATPVSTRVESTKSAAKPRTGSSPSASPGSPKKSGDSKGSSQQGETVLANFFNSLLTKKSGSPAKASPDSKAARAELDRMTRNSKPST